MQSNSYMNTSPDVLRNPQSNIPSAQPYLGASPQRTEVIQQSADTTTGQAPDSGPYSMAGGGSIQGGGDGMSDSIPAEIDGHKEAKVADGEYVVPKHIAQQYGPKLKKMMTEVRKAAHPTPGKQVVQDAAKRCFIKVMSGVG